MKISKHMLSDDDALDLRYKTPNTSGAFKSGQPDTLVLHFTAGSSAESAAAHLCKESAKASAHLVIGRDGKIFQLAPFNKVTWHAGRSSWQGRSGLNHYSIGIEIDNAGQLTANSQGVFKTWFGKTVAADEVFEGVHRNQQETSYWHAYSEVQVQTVFDLCELLVAQYGITTIVGHEEIAPTRKTDPGPAFPLDRLRNRLLGDTRDEDGDAEPLFDERTKLVSASKLNIRQGPGSQFDLAASPLHKGEAVKVLETRDGWSKVEKVTRGWVSHRYLQS